MTGAAGAEVLTYTVRTPAPEADGTAAWDATTVVVVRIRADGHEGIRVVLHGGGRRVRGHRRPRAAAGRR